MSLTQERTTSHEQYFRNDVLLSMYPVFCGDERIPEYDGLYIHVFGGVANPAYNSEIIARTRGVATDSTFQSAVGNAAHILRNQDIRAGVHSDTHAETGTTIDTEGDDPIGCGYIKLRQAISQTIAADPDRIVAEAERLMPELFADPADSHFAHRIVDAHGQLIADANFFSVGSRQVAAAAIEAGSPAMLVAGEHVGKTGMINKRSDTTMNSGTAHKDGRPIYVHDAWAAQEMLECMPATAQLANPNEREIADLIDAIGTMWALGVQEITVRR